MPLLGLAATIECAANANGTLSEYTVLSETPADQEFGSAAFKLSRLYKMGPTDADGSSVAGRRVALPVAFTASPAE
jgi:periplasmic protein TonB